MAKKMHKAEKSREPYAGYNAEVAARAAKINIHSQASAETLPGPLKDAFGVREPVKSPQVTIRKFVHYDFAILKALNSPLHRRLLELGKAVEQRQEIPFTDEDQAEMIFQFTRPCREVKALLEREGREGFRRMACDAILFSEETPLPPPFDQAAVMEIVQNLGRSYGTIIQFEAAQSESDGSFRKPPQSQKTGSVGGSIT